MAGFLESRKNALKSSVNRLAKGGYRFFHQSLGWKKLAEAKPGIIGDVVDVVRAGVDGLFSKDRGVLNPVQGWNLAPWKQESFYNPFRLARKAIAATLNTVGLAASKFVFLPTKAIGSTSANGEAFLYRLFTGIGTLPGVIIGDYSYDMGERRGAQAANTPPKTTNSTAQAAA